MSKASKSQKSPKETVGMSITISGTTAEIINKISKQSFYRNNRSMAIESLILNSPEFIKFKKK